MWIIEVISHLEVPGVPGPARPSLKTTVVVWFFWNAVPTVLLLSSKLVSVYIICECPIVGPLDLGTSPCPLLQISESSFNRGTSWIQQVLSRILYGVPAPAKAANVQEMLHQWVSVLEKLSATHRAKVPMKSNVNWLLQLESALALWGPSPFSFCLPFELVFFFFQEQGAEF